MCTCVYVYHVIAAKDVFINQERKLGVRRQSDIVLVLTIHLLSSMQYTPIAQYERISYHTLK